MGDNKYSQFQIPDVDGLESLLVSWHGTHQALGKDPDSLAEEEKLIK